MLRRFRSIVAGGVLAGLAFWSLREVRAGRLRSLDLSHGDDERFHLLAEKTSDLICLHEPDGRYLYISPSCRRLLGYEPEALLGTDPYQLFHPDDLEHIRSEAHEKALDGQGAVSVTYRIRKESGEYTWFETLTEPILDESGESSPPPDGLARRQRAQARRGGAR
jgi:PAS domain S-box-containing protein